MPVAIKVYNDNKTNKKEKLVCEIKVLEALKGGPNIIKLIAVVKDPEIELPEFVFEIKDSDDIDEIKKTFND